MALLATSLGPRLAVELALDDPMIRTPGSFAPLPLHERVSSVTSPGREITMRNIDSRYQAAIAMLFAGVLGCGKDGDGGGGATQTEIDTACQSYCQMAHLCDDEIAADECTATCVDRMGDCMADEQGQAVDDLESCAKEACDDFTSCTVGAGFQCAFGI
ncbi:hypothetical protein [Nannocystis pusilla]|uniref:VDE lipocalin domain-containing protein n=1 Tax=Nannocystis pusilla TaxID=889268 RepID=A0ABS7U567_9BACT|nr:hypothetical protein [Nannocystis pusilla]MBZ5715708.1 hypothetical protein [Nannocystis pusilla]